MADGSQARNNWAIGIDLGTENTRVAVFRDDRIEVIPDYYGNRNMPSMVSFSDTERLIVPLPRLCITVTQGIPSSTSNA